MAERVKLIVTETKDIQAIGDKGAKKLAFKATNADGRELAYFTWRTQIFPHITVGSELDAEVETTSREYEGNVYTDRKVNQLYIEGQPVIKGSSGDGKWRSKSPEEMELSRRSFALAYAKDLVVADKIKIGDLLDWATKLEQFMVGEKSEQKAQEVERSQEDISQSQDTLVAEIKKLADGATIRAAMDKLGYTEAKLSDCDAGKLAQIREYLKPGTLV